jgi:hypothetical protein
MSNKAKLLSQIESPLVRETVSFVYSTIQLKLDAFFRANISVIDLSTDEHKLEYTDLYKKYEALLEDHLNEFAQQKGYNSGAEFYEALSKAASENERSNKMMQMVLAAADYDKFVNLIRIKAKLAVTTFTADKDCKHGEERKEREYDDSAFYDEDDEDVDNFSKGESKESDERSSESKQSCK